MSPAILGKLCFMSPLFYQKLPKEGEKFITYKAAFVLLFTMTCLMVFVFISFSIEKI